MREFFGTLFSLYGLLIFALGVALSGWVMMLLNRGKSAVRG